MMTSRRARALAAALTVATLALTGCSSSSSEGTSATAAEPTPTPTPTSVIWAGQVCTDFDNVKAGVSALGRNLNYDVTSDRSALDQIDRQLRIQVLAIADGVDRLLQTLTQVPADFGAAAQFANDVTKSGTDAKAAAQEVLARLDAAKSADNVIAAGKEILAALVAAKAAFQAGQTFVTTITDATSSANSELREAFDAAPECQDATASPSVS